MSFPVVIATYGAVLLAELVGDKTLYVASSLATRFGPGAVLAGIAPAAALKMLAAVALGSALASLPPVLTAALTTATFLWAAFVIWREPLADETVAAVASPAHGATAAFLAIIGSEWADPGQLAAAALAASSRAPGSVWAGATAAMLTKAVAAVTLGVGIRRVLPPRTIRYLACAVCLAMGIVSALRVAF